MRLSLTIRSGRAFSVRTERKRSFALRCRPFDRCAKIPTQKIWQYLEQLINNMVLNILFQLIKHAERFVLELDQWISLPNRAEMDACAQNIHSIDVIEKLETELKRPVVTSNQAALWCALRTLGLKDVAPGLGTLFRHDLAKAAAA